LININTEPPKEIEKINLEEIINSIRDIAISQANARHVPFDGSWELVWWTKTTEETHTGQIKFSICAEWRET
jgi:hypothetical protein